MAGESEQNWDDLLSLGGVFGLFFVIQTYGYQVGISPGSEPDASKQIVLTAVTNGARHLSHILLPFSGVAWPLGPTVCCVLLLYATFLPSQLRRAGSDARASRMLSRFVVLLIAMSILVCSGATLIRYPWALELWRGPAAVQYYEVPAYILLVWATWRALPRRRLQSATLRLAGDWSDHPWPEITRALCIAWLFLLAFLGSEIDGRLDAHRHNQRLENSRSFHADLPAAVRDGSRR